jgi:hypothetical protein
MKRDIDISDIKRRLRAPFAGATTSCPQCGYIRGIENWHRGVPSDVLEVVGQLCNEALAVIESLENANAPATH